jgi:hypothetical protein
MIGLIELDQVRTIGLLASIPDSIDALKPTFSQQLYVFVGNLFMLRNRNPREGIYFLRLGQIIFVRRKLFEQLRVRFRQESKLRLSKGPSEAGHGRWIFPRVLLCQRDRRRRSKSEKEPEREYSSWNTHHHSSIGKIEEDPEL